MIKLSKSERDSLHTCLKDYLKDGRVQQMNEYIQHGNVTTLDHCMNVTRMSMWLNHRLHIGGDDKSLAVGALLHDFYLYDWHCDDDGSHRLHGFSHPGKASENAKKYFNIGQKEQKIIESHMWPLTISKLPSSREAVIVCIADKYCSAYETLFLRSGESKPICE